MPFTPFHFGPHACVSLPLQRYLDVPVFVGANLVIDLEPLLVMTFNPDYPVHGYCHTLIFGSPVGILLATSAHPFIGRCERFMSRVRLSYTTTYLKMAVSGVLGVWLHVVFDAPLYDDIRPLYPLQENPLLEVLPPGAVYGICAACLVPAGLLYIRETTRSKSVRALHDR